MPRPVRPWFRFYVEAFGDRKIRRLKPEHRWLFAACLGAARQSPVPGVLLVSEGQPMDEYDLADYAALDVRTVRTGLRSLGDLGLIVKGSPGDLEENAYRSPAFQNRQFESDDVTKRTRKHRLTSADEGEGTFQPRSGERSSNGDGNAPERVRARATETETETETENPSSASAAADDARDGSEPDRFDEFWDVYDKKVGRKKAEQKYRLALKKRGITADLLIDAARAYIASQRAKGKHPEFTKDPTTWLNGEHWGDEDVSSNVHQMPARTPFPVNGTEAEQDAWVRAQPLPTDGAYYGGSVR